MLKETELSTRWDPCGCQQVELSSGVLLFIIFIWQIFIHIHFPKVKESLGVTELQVACELWVVDPGLGHAYMYTWTTQCTIHPNKTIFLFTEILWVCCNAELRQLLHCLNYYLMQCPKHISQANQKFIELDTSTHVSSNILCNIFNHMSVPVMNSFRVLVCLTTL